MVAQLYIPLKQLGEIKSGGGMGGWSRGFKNPYRSSKKNYRDICLYVFDKQFLFAKNN
jgi:hypothetical protein